MIINWVIPSLHKGGAEVVILRIASQILAIRPNYCLRVIIRKPEVDFDLNDFHPRLEIICLKADKLRRFVLPLYKYMRANRNQVYFGNIWPLSHITTILANLTQSRGFAIEHGKVTANKGVLNLSYYLSKIMGGKFIFVSSGLSSFFLKQTTANIRPIIINNPLGQKFGQRKEHQIQVKKGKVTFLIAARLKEVKNIELALNAISYDKMERFELVIAGDGSLRHSLEQMASDLNISSVVHFKGFVDEIIDEYSRCDILLSTSFSEGFGNTIIEALAQGLYVVATPTFGAKEIILDDNLGQVLVNYDDPIELYNLMHKISSNVDKIYDSRRYRIKYADGRFSLSNIVTQYLNLIEA